jgi:GR25 family glycosyltransferase involved in LPS biosynthesis
MSMKYYIVTLQHEEERVNWVKSHLIPNIKTLFPNPSNSNISIYFGVDGRRMCIPEITWWVNNNYLPENYKINPAEGIPFRQGQIGCALSHIRIWEDVYLNKVPYACILEDDAKINNQESNLMDQIINELPLDWDHCNLYHHPKFLKELNDPTLKLSDDKNLIIKGVPMWGTVGYLISHRGVRKLLKYTKPIFNTIDEMIKYLITKNIIKSYTIKVPFIDTVGHIVSNTNTNNQSNQINNEIKIKSTIWSSDPI